MRDDLYTPSIILTFHPSGWAVQAHLANTLFYVASLDGYTPEKVKLVPFVNEKDGWTGRFRVGDLFQCVGNYYKVTKMVIGSSPHVMLEQCPAPNKETVNQDSMF